MFSARSTSNWQMRTLNKSTLYFKAKFSASSHGRISKILIKTTTRNLTVTFSLNGALLSSYVIIKKNKIKKKNWWEKVARLNSGKKYSSTPERQQFLTIVFFSVTVLGSNWNGRPSFRITAKISSRRVGQLGCSALSTRDVESTEREEKIKNETMCKRKGKSYRLIKKVLNKK